jgi:DNA-binding transcriptional LysR family regulator
MSRRFGDLELGSIEIFCLAAELGSFTGAATAAGVTPAAVSRSINRLEERLGVRLFVRTTRQVRLTDGGASYYAQCREALNHLIEGESEATGAQSTPAGLVRISAPTPFAHARLLPLLAKFRKKYPEVRLEIHVSNRNIDFYEEGFDLAIRGRAPADTSLVGRKLEDAELVLVAAPAYLRAAGRPKTLDDLDQHDCIQFNLPSTGRKIPWLFMVDGAQVERHTSGGFVISEDILGQVALVRNGAGLAQVYRSTVEDLLADGSLVELLPRFGGSSRPFLLLYPHARHLPLRVRVVVDFLIEAAQKWGKLKVVKSQR